MINPIIQALFVNKSREEQEVLFMAYATSCNIKKTITTNGDVEVLINNLNSVTIIDWDLGTRVLNTFKGGFSGGEDTLKSCTMGDVNANPLDAIGINDYFVELLSKCVTHKEIFNTALSKFTRMV